MKKICILLSGILCLQLQAQQWSEEETSGRMNLGLKLGTGFGGVFGKELKNPRPLIGFNAGLYLHGKDTIKRFNWQTGLDIRFRGSNFANGDSGNTAYTRLGLITLDAPFLANIRVGALKTGKYKALQAGVDVSYILKSIVYIGADKIPAQRDNYLKTWRNLPLNPFDFQAVLGYQNRGQVIGFQCALKFSVLNMNRNFSLPGLLPKTGTGGNIGTWNVEIGLLF